MQTCECDICQATKLTAKLARSVHPWELMYGIDTLYSYNVRTMPGLKIWQYDEMVPRKLRRILKAPDIELKVLVTGVSNDRTGTESGV